MNIDLHHGDCLEVMKDIPDQSVDLICTDPPYAVTQAEWDTLVPIAPMWEQLNRIIKPKGTTILCAQQPFTTDLISGNRKDFKYATVWDKIETNGFLSVQTQRLTQHEDILVFGGGTYNPQMTKRDKIRKRGYEKPINTESYNKTTGSEGKIYTHRFPTSINSINPPARNSRHHGHEKPVELMEYLIKTYSNEEEVVLDFTMGSGSTGVAAVKCERSFIGIELDPDYFKICEERIYGADTIEKHVESLLEF